MGILTYVVFAVCLLLCGRTHAQPLSGRPAASSTGHAPGHAHCALQHLAHRRGDVRCAVAVVVVLLLLLFSFIHHRSLTRSCSSSCQSLCHCRCQRPCCPAMRCSRASLLPPTHSCLTLLSSSPNRVGRKPCVATPYTPSYLTLLSSSPNRVGRRPCVATP